MALFAWIACLSGCWILRRTGLKGLLLLSVGMAIGAETLLAFFSCKGVLVHFLPPPLGMSVIAIFKKD